MCGYRIQIISCHTMVMSSVRQNMKRKSSVTTVDLQSQSTTPLLIGVRTLLFFHSGNPISINGVGTLLMAGTLAEEYYHSIVIENRVRRHEMSSPAGLETTAADALEFFSFCIK